MKTFPQMSEDEYYNWYVEGRLYDAVVRARDLQQAQRTRSLSSMELTEARALDRIITDYRLS